MNQYCQSMHDRVRWLLVGFLMPWLVAQEILPLAADSEESDPPATPLNPAPLNPGMQPAIIPFAVQPTPAMEPLPGAENLQAEPVLTEAFAAPESTADPEEDFDEGTEASQEIANGESETATDPWTFVPGFSQPGAFTNAGAMGGTGMAFNGFDGGWGGMPQAALSSNPLLQGLVLSASLIGTYDTNPSRGFGPPEDAGQGDFYLTLGGAIEYRSTASTWTYGALYSGAYSQYFSQTDLSGSNQRAAASVDYDGGPLTATFNFGVNYDSGANRYYASVVDQVSIYYGLTARYTLSPKTVLTGNLSQNHTSASGSGNSDTSSFNLGTSALWKYSPLTEFGPGIRYTSRSGNSGGDRTSIGPTLTFNYGLSEKVSFNSTIGTDFAEYDDGESADPSLYTMIGLNYRASNLWGMNLSLIRDSQASYSEAARFEEMTALRLGYQRKVRRAYWSVGMSWESRVTENPDPSRFTDVPDRDYVSFDSSLSMAVLANTCNASIFMRYSDQSGGPGQSWDSLLLGFGISRSF